MARQLECEALEDVLGHMEAEQGPVDEDEVASIMTRLTSIAGPR